MGIDELLKGKREDILRIAAQHGARNVRIFGSVVRGEAGPDSDVDLLVDAGPDRTPFFPGGLIADLEDLLDRKVDILTEAGLHWYIRERVLQEAVPLCKTIGSIGFIFSSVSPELKCEIEAMLASLGGTS